MCGETNCGLDDDERERKPHDQTVASFPALEEVDDRGGNRGRRDSGAKAAQLQSGVEGAERQEALAQKPRQPRHEDAAEGRLGQAAFVSLRKRSSCC